MAEELVLGVDFDLSEADKAIDKMQKHFNSAQRECEQTLKTLNKLSDQIEEINQKEKTGVQLTSAERAQKDAMIEQSATLSARYDELRERAERFRSALANARMNPESLAEADQHTQNLGDHAQRAAGEIKKAGNQTGALKSGISSAASGMSKFVTRVAGLAKRVFVFSVITSALRKVRSAISAAISSNERLSSSFSRIRGNLSVAFQPLIQLAVPYIEKFCQWIERATQYIALMIHALTGADMQKSIEGAKKLHDAVSGKSANDGQIKAIDKQIKAYQKQIKALQAQEKAIKKQYDAEKQVLDKKKSALNEQIKGIDEYIAALKKREKADQKAIDAQKDALSEQIKVKQSQKKERQSELAEQRSAANAQVEAANKEIKALQKQRKAIEKAKKDEQKSLAGFDTMQILSGSGEDDDPELQAIDAQIEALEEKRDMLQEVADAIPSDADDPLLRQIDAEIEALQAEKDAIADADYSPMIEQQELAKESLQEQIELIDKQAEKLQEDYELKLEVKRDAIEKIQEQIEKLNAEKDALKDAEDGANKFQSSLDKIHLSENFEKILQSLEKMKKWWDENGDQVKKFITIAGGIGAIAGVVYGIIKALTLLRTEGLGKLLGGGGALALIIVAIAAIVTLTGHADEMIGDLKLVLKGFSDFLTGVFSGDTEMAINGLKQMAVGLGNAVIVIVESIINIGIKALNWLVDKLRSFSLDPPEWVKKITGWEGSEKGWFANFKGFEEYQIPFRFELPALARGAVIPGGKPWVAMLGDQPAGQTNIEAPLATIEDAVDRALDRRGITGDTNVSISFNGSLAQFARVLEPEIEVARKRSSAFA